MIETPAGYKLMPGNDAFMQANGPVWRRRLEDGRWAYGFTAEDRHNNGNDMVHGGMLFSFLDHVMGFSVAMAARRTSATISMNVNFLIAGRIGDWIEGEVTITRLTNSLGFAQGRAFHKHRTLMTADGVFKLIGDGF